MRGYYRELRNIPFDIPYIEDYAEKTYTGNICNKEDVLEALQDTE